jgi:hypothetical protein
VPGVVSVMHCHRARYVRRYCGANDMKGCGMEVVQTKRIGGNLCK